MKKSKAAIIAGVLGILYTIYLMAHFGGAIVNTTSDAEALGGAICIN